MEEINSNMYYHYTEWLVNTKNRWCSFVIQKSYYDEGVVLEEYDEDGEFVQGYVLSKFPKNKIPYTNQEKDQVVVIVLEDFNK